MKKYQTKKMRGGSGRNQGRKKGSRNKRKQAEIDKHAEEGELPLGYLLRVMRDPKTTKARADRMAILALPFCHAKLAPMQADPKTPPPGKKQQAAAAAQTAGQGTEWGNDLEPPPSPRSMN